MHKVYILAEVSKNKWAAEVNISKYTGIHIASLESYTQETAKKGCLYRRKLSGAVTGTSFFLYACITF